MHLAKLSDLVSRACVKGARCCILSPCVKVVRGDLENFWALGLDSAAQLRHIPVTS